MNTTVAIGAGLCGAVAGIPVVAIAYAVPQEGPVRLPAQWWLGRPAPSHAVAPVVALTGSSAALVCGRLHVSFALPAFWLFAVLGVGLAIVDLRRHRLPHRLTVPLYVAFATGFTGDAIITGHPAPFARAAVAACITTTALFTLALAFPGQLGLGDVVLAGAVTFSLGWLSWLAAILGLLAGLGIQALTVVIVRARRATRGRAIPMGPSLLTGWILAIAMVAT